MSLYTIYGWVKKTLKSYPIQSALILPLALIVLVWIGNSIELYIRNLPPGATNGDWSARIVGDADIIYRNAENIWMGSPNVIRAVILSESQRVVFSHRYGYRGRRDIYNAINLCF